MFSTLGWSQSEAPHEMASGAPSTVCHGSISPPARHRSWMDAHYQQGLMAPVEPGSNNANGKVIWILIQQPILRLCSLSLSIRPIRSWSGLLLYTTLQLLSVDSYSYTIFLWEKWKMQLLCVNVCLLDRCIGNCPGAFLQTERNSSDPKQNCQ